MRVKLPALDAHIAAMRAYGFGTWSRAGREIARRFGTEGLPVAALERLNHLYPTLHLYAQPSDEQPPATQNKGGQLTPGKYVVFDADPVNCGQGRCRCGILPVDLPSEGVEGHTRDSTSPYFVSQPEPLSSDRYVVPLAGPSPVGPADIYGCWRQGLKPRTR